MQDIAADYERVRLPARIPRKGAIAVMGLLLAIISIGLVILLLRRPRQQAALPPLTGCDRESEDEYLIAVITAAIQEYSGSGEFEVVRIKPRAQNWILTGRQNLLANR